MSETGQPERGMQGGQSCEIGPLERNHADSVNAAVNYP